MAQRTRQAQRTMREEMQEDRYVEDELNGLMEMTFRMEQELQMLGLDSEE